MDRSLRRHLELRLATHLRGPVRQFTDQTEIRIEAGSVVEVLQTLHDDPGLRFEILADLAGVDTGKVMQVVYHLWSERSPTGFASSSTVYPGRPARALGHFPVDRRRVARARGLRHVRHHLRGQPRPAPHPDAADYTSFPLRKDFYLPDDAARSPGAGTRHVERPHAPAIVADDPTAGVRRAPVS